jgi:pyruvate dehydrogenase E2 component (dihydrolipoamide acetyltransferase)
MRDLRTRVGVSPRARRALRQLGVDSSGISGTGPSGRIVEADVIAYSRRAPVSSGTSTMRQMIAQRTAEAAATIPHFYLRAEVDVSALVDTRKQIAGSVEKREGIKITYTDFLMRALALALRECPRANAVWTDNALVPLPSANVGLVIGLEEGLMIPVTANADTLSVTALARERIALQSDADLRKRQCALPAAISLSNLGNSRVDEFDAIIPTGQSMILGVGRIAPRPFVVGERIELRQTLRLSLALDHRVHDGAPGANFLASLINFLERPAALLI